MTWRHNSYNVTSRRYANWHVHRRAFERGDHKWTETWDFQQCDMCDQHETQISLRIHAVWSEPLLVACILCACYAIDWTPLECLSLNLLRLVWVYTCQNVTLLEITCRCLNYKSSWYPIGTSVPGSWRLLNSGRSRVAGPTVLAEYVFRRVPFSPFS